MLEHVYRQFHETLLRTPGVTDAKWHVYAGQRFYYVETLLPAGAVGDLLMEAGECVTAGTKLKAESIFVRSLPDCHVFRFRFLVPNEKQFCCGNLCEDCFLLREQNKENG